MLTSINGNSTKSCSYTLVRWFIIVGWAWASSTHILLQHIKHAYNSRFVTVCSYTSMMRQLTKSNLIQSCCCWQFSKHVWFSNRYNLIHATDMYSYTCHRIPNISCMYSNRHSITKICSCTRIGLVTWGPATFLHAWHFNGVVRLMWWVCHCSKLLYIL